MRITITKALIGPNNQCKLTLLEVLICSHFPFFSKYCAGKSCPILNLSVEFILNFILLTVCYFVYLLFSLSLLYRAVIGWLHFVLKILTCYWLMREWIRSAKLVKDMRHKTAPDSYCDCFYIEERSAHSCTHICTHCLLYALTLTDSG